MKSNNLSVIVTGSHGYIGNNLVQHFGKKGWSCHCIDKKIGIDLTKNVHVIENMIDSAGTDQHFVPIIHMAALPGLDACRKNPLEGFKDNVRALETILDYMNESKYFLVFFSSQAADEPGKSLYAYNKAICEDMLKGIKNKIILRLSNVYGGEGFMTQKNTVIKKMIEAQQNDRVFAMHGTGGQERNFVHVSDVCEAVACIVKFFSNKLNDGLQSKIDKVDIYGNDTFTIRDLTKRLNLKTMLSTENPGKIEVGKLNKYAKTYFGYEPKESLMPWLNKRCVVNLNEDERGNSND